MSVTFGSEPPTILKVSLGKSKFDSKQPIYEISMDGREFYGKPIITVNVGKTYIFEIDTPKCPFYITTDSVGGGFNESEFLSMRGAIDIIPENTNEKGNIGIEKGTLTWIPKYTHSEMKLYYQCNFYSGLGNEIKVVLG